MSRLSRIMGVVGAAALLACSDQPTAPARTALSPPGASFNRLDDGPANAHLLVTGLHRARGSAVGPDGALYVTESEVGRISRVDPEDGTVTTFASGLPTSPLAAGGAEC